MLLCRHRSNGLLHRLAIPIHSERRAAPSPCTEILHLFAHVPFHFGHGRQQRSQARGRALLIQRETARRDAPPPAAPILASAVTKIVISALCNLEARPSPISYHPPQIIIAAPQKDNIVASPPIHGLRASLSPSFRWQHPFLAQRKWGLVRWSARWASGAVSALESQNQRQHN
jgi:hypothetical protein